MIMIVVLETLDRQTGNVASVDHIHSQGFRSAPLDSKLHSDYSK